MLLLLTGLAVFLFVRFSLLREVPPEQRADTIAGQVRELSSLVTSKTYVKAVVEQENNKIFGKTIEADRPGTKRKTIVIIPGKVTAGVNLAKITEKDIRINEEEKKVHITVPMAGKFYIYPRISHHISDFCKIRLK